MAAPIAATTHAAGTTQKADRSSSRNRSKETMDTRHIPCCVRRRHTSQLITIR